MSALHGVIAIDKPEGATSHDVVQFVRWALREKSVGHCGTLDPMATGLLVVCVGEATKLANVLHAADKRYTATVKLGEATDTGDAEGKVIARAKVDDELRARAAAAAIALRGTLMLAPPAFSAIKERGIAAYVRARLGERVELAPRPMTIHDVKLLGHSEYRGHRVSVELFVGKGTYVRSWAVALGEAIGVPAHLHSLRRIASGPLHVDHVRTVHGLEVIATHEGHSGKPRARFELRGAIERDEAAARLRAAMVGPIHALPAEWLRALAPDPERFERLCQGLPQWATNVGVPADATAESAAVLEPSGDRLVLVRLEPEPEGLRAVPTRLLRLAGPPAAPGSEA
ncbi:MAG TPA: tRNA pseudouridine(55) synthase TruB [Nannocystaceae bacterium]|nr:tRNA pseudouridine(55) synthase TruB [Nannocystaceae bacterium]